MWLYLYAAGTTTAASDGLSFFQAVAGIANTVVGIIQWAAIIFCVFKISVLGFQIITNKNSTEVFRKVKDEGIAIVVGLALVLAAFPIKGALQDVIQKNVVNVTKDSSVTSVDKQNDVNWGTTTQ